MRTSHRSAATKKAGAQPPSDRNLHLREARNVTELSYMPIIEQQAASPQLPAGPSAAGLESSEALLAFLEAQPRTVRIFNQRFEVLWRSRPPGSATELRYDNASAETESIPPEGLERDRWPVNRVLKGIPKAVRLYTKPVADPTPTGPDFLTWRVTAWSMEVRGQLLLVEETEQVDSPEEDAHRLKRLDQDVEDLLHNVVSYLQHGGNSKELRLPNPHLQNCHEIRGCLNPECPAYDSPNTERCWEITSKPSCSDDPAQSNLLAKVHSCSHCRVFGLASPDPLIRISENFNRLISLLQLKYQEALDVQHRMQQADKLAIMGELLASIAHEIKNPLGIIVGRLDVIGLEMESLSPEVLAEDLGTIYQQANRVRQIIDHLLRMARPEPPALHAVHLNAIIQDSLAMVRKTLSERGVDIELDLQGDLPAIQADHIQVQQVILNLMLNARDAMEEGGTLTIRSLLDDQEEPGVRITVSDTGIGMAPDQLERLFSSFHTTKVNQGGTGLGLAVCRRIMRVHSGKIHAESTVNKGTSMHLWFPRGRTRT
jgi:nitrogen-specific signal transduction histidine kinase